MHEPLGLAREILAAFCTATASSASVLVEMDLSSLQRRARSALRMLRLLAVLAAGPCRRFVDAREIEVLPPRWGRTRSRRHAMRARMRSAGRLLPAISESAISSAALCAFLDGASSPGPSRSPRALVVLVAADEREPARRAGSTRGNDDNVIRATRRRFARQPLVQPPCSRLLEGTERHHRPRTGSSAGSMSPRSPLGQGCTRASA